MVTRDANEHPGTISGEIQGGRPLHFLRLLSCCPLLDYGTKYKIFAPEAKRHHHSDGHPRDGAAVVPRRVSYLLAPLASTQLSASVRTVVLWLAARTRSRSTVSAMPARARCREREPALTPRRPATKRTVARSLARRGLGEESTTWSRCPRRGRHHRPCMGQLMLHPLCLRRARA
jgi:hypothetical protein